MNSIDTLSLALGSAWTAGINLYATVATLGIAAAAGVIDLPPDLQVLAHPTVITIALAMYFIEFFADKTPYLDSAWDAVHTFIRVPAGAILASRALGHVSPPVELAAMLAGGGIALSAHAAKATTRLAINASPEPFSNWLASFAEDVVALFGLWLVFTHPVAMLVLVLGFVVLVVWLAPRIWRGLAALFHRARRFVGGSQPPATTPAA